MDNTKRKVEDLMTAIDRIVDSRESKADLFGFDEERESLKEKLGISTHNPQQVYNLFYGNIQSFLSNILPKDAAINAPIRNLVCTLLSHQERKYITSGKRGADSKMASSEDMEELIDIFYKWSETPNDLFRLANILLERNKELKYIPKDRTLQDYV
jgi:hypothetical protein bacD2_02607